MSLKTKTQNVRVGGVEEMNIKCLHLDDLGLLELIWWEDIFAAINPRSTHWNSHNNEIFK